MQGKKHFKPKLFVNWCLPDMIPDNNFYKILKSKLDLSFVYVSTRDVYSHTGKPSVDPVVFFKMLLVGYLENVCSDRALERLFQLRLDLLYFIDHDIDERVPDHSTICKTRKRIPTAVFEEVFSHILGLCIEEGMVSGKIQSIDTAYINANASLDRMTEIKMVDRSPEEYLSEVKSQDEPSTEEREQARKRLEKSQKTLENFTEHRRKKYTQQDGGRPHKKNKRRFLSNATHLSQTDPDARVAKKSGKPRMLCYTSIASVDTQENVITHIGAEHASKKDSRLLLDATEQTLDRLESHGLQVDTILAGAGFSSGENYYILNAWGLKSYIPIHGGFKEKREGFEYDKKQDRYICHQGINLPFKSVGKSGGYDKKRYISSKRDCDQCAFRVGCVDTRGVKKIEHTIYHEEYMEMINRLKSPSGKSNYFLRMQSVEPVFGTLQQHYGLRWINARGLSSADKIMLMAGAALNLKKWMRKLIENGDFTPKWSLIRSSCIKEGELILKAILRCSLFYTLYMQWWRGMRWV